MDKERRHHFILPRDRPLRWMLPGLVLIGLLLLQWLAPGWAARAEAWTVDARFRLRGEEGPRNSIFVVALDEDSFQLMKDVLGENLHFWPRARWAELVERIASGGPRIVGLDTILDAPGWDEGGDETLARALASAGNVILAANIEHVAGDVGRQTAVSSPVHLLSEQAAAVGLVGFPVDADGAVRQLNVNASFSLAVASLFAGEAVVSKDDLADGGTLPVHFRGSEGTFETLPLWRVLPGDLVPGGFVREDELVDPGIWRDAIVLVGYTTQVAQDRHQAPFGGEAGLPGVELQANAIDTLLAGDWLHRAPGWLGIILVGMTGVAALGALNLRRPVAGVAALLAIMALYLVLAQALFSGPCYVLPLVAPLAASLAVGGVALAERVIFAERDKRRLRRRFAGVMSPERLRAVLDNWESLIEPERPRKEASILFADVRGFTNATETLMREGRSPEMVRFLSAYLDAMSEAVFSEGGVIYDVVGDGLMILFGVPEPFPDHAQRAVRAAVRMALATKELQAVWPLRGERPLGMGIGVHCGVVVDAIVGRGRRVEYAVIGDPVNTSARIEAHCKVAMEIPRTPGGQVPETVTVLLSAGLYEKVREHVLVDANVPPFEARGKAEPLRVVRLLGMRGWKPDAC